MSKNIEERKQAVVTDHGKQRIKNRLGLSKKIADKISQKALEGGVKHSNTTGTLRKYIDSIYLKERKANNIRIYNRKVYLFRDEILITVLNLPNRFSTIADKLQKKNKD